MRKTYKPWAPRQDFLLAPSPSEWLPPSHLVYFLLDLGEVLDISPIEARLQAKDARGQRSYDPLMMVVLLLYAYCVGVPSSRRIERATYEDVGFRVLTGGQHPDHTRISEFRRQNLRELAALFVQVLQLCQKAGLVKLGHVALDGTKMKANGSKHKAMSHERMVKTEDELAAEVEALLKQAEEQDDADDAQYGPGRRGDELPDELSRRESRLQKLRKAKKELEAEAAAAQARKRRLQADEARKAASDAAPDEKAKAQRRAESIEAKATAAAELAEAKAAEAGLSAPDLEPRRAEQPPSHQVQADKNGKPSPKAQRNFTDPDSRIMKAGTDFVQGYNAQAAVDAAHQIIVGQLVTNQAPDTEHLVPVLIQVQANTGASPEKVSADAGYWSEANADAAKNLGIDAYIATGRLKHGESPPPVRGRMPKGLDAKGRMRRKLRTKNGKEVYARRKAIVEPVFGQIKGARGLRAFLLRGMQKVGAEWALICTTHNILKLFRSGLAIA